MNAYSAWLALLAASTAGAAHAATAQEDAAAFGARESILDVSLSPNGERLAFISPDEGAGEVLYVVNITGGEAVPEAVAHNDQVNADINYCDWATNDRLVCQMAAVSDANGVLLLGFSRLFAINADGSGSIILSARDTADQLGVRQNGGSVVALDYGEEDGTILMTRQWIKEYSTGTHMANEDEGLGVDRVDVADGRHRVLERADPAAAGYLADENGRVRLKSRHRLDGSGLLTDTREFFYRRPDDNGWERLSRVEIDAQSASGFYPVAIDSAKNIAYGFDDKDGYDALYSITLDGNANKELVLSHDGADVDQLIRIGRQRRVVGASYATEKREVSYIDPELDRLARMLGAALPGQPLINIVDASADESKLLVIASSDTDPGMIYRLDRKTLHLDELLPLRRPLEGRAMAPMQPVSFPAADGTNIPGYLTVPPGAQGPIPAIVLPHGGPSARDEWGFDWLVQFFAARGYAVLQPNFRGSSGYGDEWFGRNGFQQWQTAIGDVNDAGRWLVDQGIADPQKLAIVGWSYGGYAALQSQVLDPDLYHAVVAIAPVTDLDRLKEESRRFTSFRLVSDFVGSGPHVRQGSPAQNAAAFHAPVLLFHGTDDQNVAVQQSRLMEDRLKDAGKPVEYIEYEGMRHSLSNSGVRTDMLGRIDAFLTQALGS